jgi:threonine synthase
VTFVSTRGSAPPVSFREALLSGLAPDGGLYVPSHLPVLPRKTWTSLRGRSLAAIGTAMLAPFVEAEVPATDLDALLEDALDFPTPLVRLDHRLSVLELFHGPTFAFKDVGARVLARLMSYFAHGSAAAAPLTVLVATSGDTGGAVARAFYRVPQTRVVVLYPRGQVSAVQESQFATLGDNVTTLAVEGTFDDCQRLVKQAFADAGLRERANLTSANSISLGRLLPQMIYYAYAMGEHPAEAPPVVTVPSGNFGNLAAGLMARQMGVAIERFVAATTINDTVARYLESGAVEPRRSVATLANAMDVGDPSNLERIRWMFGDDVRAIRPVVSTSVHTDEELEEAIVELDRRYGYVADPHTAIAYLGARSSGGVFLATAHPAKFGETVEATLGRPVETPAALVEAMGRPNLSKPIEPRLSELARYL